MLSLLLQHLVGDPLEPRGVLGGQKPGGGAVRAIGYFVPAVLDHLADRGVLANQLLQLVVPPHVVPQVQRVNGRLHVLDLRNNAHVFIFYAVVIVLASHVVQALEILELRTA